MADKFRTDKERNKWSSIQSSAGTTIENMMKGQATPSDIKSMSALLAKYDAMAGKLYDDAIESAEATADAVIDKMNEDRIALGKSPLSGKAHDRLFKQTFQKVLSASTEDIIGTLQDYFDEKFDESKEETQTMISDALSKVTGLVASKKEEKQELQVWRKRTADIAESVAEKVDGPVLSAVKKLKGDLKKSYDDAVTKSPLLAKVEELRGKVGKMYSSTSAAARAKTTTALTNIKSFWTKPDPSSAIAPENSILGKLRHALMDRKPTKFATLADYAKSKGVRSKKDIIEDIQRKNELDPNLAKKTPVDKQIEQALADNKKLQDKAEQTWDSMKKDKEGTRQESMFQWVRTLKNAFGDKFDHVKKAAKGGGGWLATIAKVLGLALTAPQLISSIADGISKYLNFETISNFLSKTWDDIKDSGSKVIDWVIDKVKDWLGIGKKSSDVATVTKSVNAAYAATANKPVTSDEAQKQIPIINHQLSDLTSRLVAAQKTAADDKRAGKPVDEYTSTVLVEAPQRIAILKQRLAKYQGADKQAPAGTNVASATSLVPKPTTSVGAPGGAGITAATATGGGPTGPAPSATKIVSDSSAGQFTPDKQSLTKTAIQSEANPTFGKSVAVDDPARVQQQQQEAQQSASLTSGNAVSLGSFGFNTSDDSLHVMNIGALG